MGQGCDGRGGIAHRSLLRVDGGNVEGARSRLFPVHRHHTPIVTGQSVPDSVEERNLNKVSNLKLSPDFRKLAVVSASAWRTQMYNRKPGLQVWAYQAEEVQQKVC